MSTPICQSCGCMMKDKNNFPRGNYSSCFCAKCVDCQGKLKPREIIRVNMIRYHVNEKGMDRGKAAEIVDNLMNTLPFWKKERISAT